jgi:hypothetical protein
VFSEFISVYQRSSAVQIHVFWLLLLFADASLGSWKTFTVQLALGFRVRTLHLSWN